MQIAGRLHAVTVGDAANQFRGDERFDDVMFGRERAGRLAAAQQEIGQNRAELIAGKRRPRGVLVQRFPHGAAEPVAIGIGGQNQFGAGPFARSIMTSNTAGFSGLATWLGTLGKSPSGAACGPNVSTSSKPAAFSTG